MTNIQTININSQAMSSGPGGTSARRSVSGPPGSNVLQMFGDRLLHPETAPTHRGPSPLCDLEPARVNLTTIATEEGVSATLLLTVICDRYDQQSYYCLPTSRNRDIHIDGSMAKDQVGVRTDKRELIFTGRQIRYLTECIPQTVKPDPEKSASKSIASAQLASPIARSRVTSSISTRQSHHKLSISDQRGTSINSTSAIAESTTNLGKFRIRLAKLFGPKSKPVNNSTPQPALETSHNSSVGVPAPESHTEQSNSGSGTDNNDAFAQHQPLAKLLADDDRWND